MQVFLEKLQIKLKQPKAYRTLINTAAIKLTAIPILTKSSILMPLKVKINEPL